VLRETTSQGRCELVCPSRTNERGGERYCVKEGEGEEGERERGRAGKVRLYYSLGLILLLLFLQKQSLAFAVYLFGIGTLLTGPGLKKKHM
jgi:hypothetical protein